VRPRFDGVGNLDEYEHLFYDDNLRNKGLINIVQDLLAGLLHGKLLSQSCPLVRPYPSREDLHGDAHPPPELPALLGKVRGHTMVLGQVPEQQPLSQLHVP
jgi:hypothetical protein